MNKKILYYINLSGLIINTVLLTGVFLDTGLLLFLDTNSLLFFAIVPPILGLFISLYLREIKCLSSRKLMVQNMVVIISFLPIFIKIMYVIGIVLFVIFNPQYATISSLIY